MLNRETTFSFSTIISVVVASFAPLFTRATPTLVMGVLVVFNISVLLFYNFCNRTDQLSQPISLLRRFGLDHMVSVLIAALLACMASTQLLRS